MQTGGCRPTSVYFNSSLDPLLQNSLLSATGVPTDNVLTTVTGPALDAVPPGIEPDFIVQRGGAPFPAITVARPLPDEINITIAPGAGALERIRYTAAGPIWSNASGGRLLAYDVALPFP